MNYMYAVTIMETLEKWSENLKSWIMENYGNPILWVGIVVVGLVLFKLLFGTLNRNE